MGVTSALHKKIMHVEFCTCSYSCTRNYLFQASLLAHCHLYVRTHEQQKCVQIKNCKESDAVWSVQLYDLETASEN